MADFHFFFRQHLREICNTLIVKDPITAQSHATRPALGHFLGCISRDSTDLCGGWNGLVVEAAARERD